jgi:hypothetical protein
MEGWNFEKVDYNFRFNEFYTKYVRHQFTF